MMHPLSEDCRKFGISFFACLGDRPGLKEATEAVRAKQADVAEM